MLVFENPGEIDPRLITTLGVNVKEGDSPIGYFGTGLKYAIAISLRLGAQVEIFSGEQRFTFTTQREAIRGKDFDFIYMNGGRLGFTTELGKTWKPWMALREFYCNALDEGGSGQDALHAPQPKAAHTLIIVRGGDFATVWATRQEWMLLTKPRFSLETLAIHSGSSTTAYYNGIAVFKSLRQRFLHTYNIQTSLQLSEDRTAANYDIGRKICLALSTECQDKELLKSVLLATQDYVEHTFDWQWFQTPSECFLGVVRELRATRRALLNKSALTLCEPYLEEDSYNSVSLTIVEQKMLDRAKAFLAIAGFNITEDIIFAESLGSQAVMGLAKDGKIFIAKACFGKGTKYLASTLLEEHLHITQSLSDCSRALQDWLFDKVVSLMEELRGEPL